MHGEAFNFSHALESSGLSVRQMVIIGLLGLLVLFDGMDNQMLGLIAHDQASDLGIPLPSFGMVFSAGLIGAIVGALTLTAAADQVLGRKRVVLIGMIVAGAGTIVTPFATGIEELLVIRFLTGTGLGAALPTAISLAAEFAPPRYSRRVVTMMIAFVPFGSLLGGLLARAIVPAMGWQAVLYFAGTGTLLLTFLVTLFVPESVYFLVRKKGDHVRAKAAARMIFDIHDVTRISVDDRDGEGEDEAKKPVGRLFSSGMWRITLLFWLVFTMNQAILYFVINWTPALLAKAGMSTTAGMDAAAMFGLGGALGTIAQGWLTTRFGLFKVLVIEILIYIISMFFLPFALGAIEMVGIMVFVIAATICAYHAGCIVLLLETYPEAIKNTGFGWAFGVGRVGASGAPALAGWLLAIGWEPSAIFLAMALPGLLTGMAVMAIRGIVTLTDRR